MIPYIIPLHSHSHHFGSKVVISTQKDVTLSPKDVELTSIVAQLRTFDLPLRSIPHTICTIGHTTHRIVQIYTSFTKKREALLHHLRFARSICYCFISLNCYVSVTPTLKVAGSNPVGRTYVKPCNLNGCRVFDCFGFIRSLGLFSLLNAFCQEKCQKTKEKACRKPGDCKALRTFHHVRIYVRNCWI